MVALKRALIVDDSKSARLVLTRLLEKHELAVDARETAEGALEYLERETPDVIFMDHVMPGMDGLSAVQLIKKDPRFSAIPVLMYTSQEGAIYAEAAKASGADGVLPKQMSLADIADALQRLKVLAPRSTPAATTDAGATAAAAPAVPSLSASDVRAVVDPLVREQASELRRYLTAALDAIPDKINREVEAQISAATTELIRQLTPPPPITPPPPPKPWGIIAALNVAIIVAGVFAVFAWRSAGDVATLRATIDRQTAALSAAGPTQSPAGAESWPTERHALAYGDAPFPAPRIAQAAAWLSALEQKGFVGSARIVVSLADYCLTGNPGEGFVLAPAEMTATTCDLRGSPPDDIRSNADKEPPALATLLTEVGSRTHGEIDAKVIYTKATGYPAVGGASAAQWNAAANKGHYVEFIAQPRVH